MPEQSGFTLWTTLVFPDRHVIAQGFTIETHSGDLYCTQDDGSREYWTRFVKQGDLDVATGMPWTGPWYGALEQMAVLAGGHGDLTTDVELIGDDICPSFVDHDGSLWRIPFQAGKDVRLKGRPLATGWRLPIRGYDGTVLVRRTVKSDRDGRPFHFYGPKHRSVDMGGQGTKAALTAATERLFRIKNYGWIQGYAYHHGILYTLRGAPRVEHGWLYDDGHVMPYIERRRAIDDPMGLLLEPWPVDELGWADGAPVDGKCEPEGMCVALIDAVPTLLVGISTGHKGNYSLQIWARIL